MYSTGQKIPVRLWDCHAQLPKKTKSQNDQLIVNTVNFRLDIIKSSFLKLNMECAEQVYASAPWSQIKHKKNPRFKVKLIDKSIERDK